MVGSAFAHAGSIVRTLRAVTARFGEFDERLGAALIDQEVHASSADGERSSSSQTRRPSQLLRFRQRCGWRGDVTRRCRPDRQQQFGCEADSLRIDLFDANSSDSSSHFCRKTLAILVHPLSKSSCSHIYSRRVGRISLMRVGVPSFSSMSARAGFEGPPCRTCVDQDFSRAIAIGDVRSRS